MNMSELCAVAILRRGSFFNGGLSYFTVSPHAFFEKVPVEEEQQVVEQQVVEQQWFVHDGRRSSRAHRGRRSRLLSTRTVFYGSAYQPEVVVRGGRATRNRS
jgi:hypothetical protein